MTIKYLSPDAWRTECYRLINLPSKKFDIVFVVPYKFNGDTVTTLMVGYWFIPK